MKRIGFRQRWTGEKCMADIRFTFLLVCFIFPLSSCCGVSEKPSLSQAEERVSPRHDSGSPERIILTVTDTPSQRQAVTWRARNEITNPKAQIVPATHFSAFMEYVNTTDAVGEKVRLGKEDAVYHYSAVFKDLIPGTFYLYRVGTEDNWSEWNRFRTAGNPHDPFTFVYLGDPQEEIKSMCSPVFRAAYQKAPEAQFWLITGDLVDDGDQDWQWGDFFYALGWIPGTTPMMLIPGNHEYPDKRYVKGKDYRLFDLWRPHFTLPENGPSGLAETAYFVDYQSVRFIMLNGNEKLEEQARWLDEVLSENRRPWIIVSIHQPIYATSVRRNKATSDRKQSELQDLMVPLFDKYSVDLVLQGHEHTYCRSYPIRNGAVVGGTEKGTVYVISVSGPKFYRTQAGHQELMAKAGLSKQLFQVIHVDPDRLTFTSFDIAGEVYDRFTLNQ